MWRQKSSHASFCLTGSYRPAPQEAQSKTDEAASKENITSKNIVPANVSTGKETEIVEAESQEPVVKPVDQSAEQ